ncbi:hypothetical protein NEMIN01_0464 [Nematocida minor]|uniref:uncharacterized protein n=1 Tax=Nematocida minor TaxID=1912983 RepID=UPI00221F656F|nr:uncharacterized protein NEMIN01_0464 [Nematocida minor]KAI5189401.1 hypothetical protein NEMIN01_0464 [Nematocida minor]
MVLEKKRYIVFTTNSSAVFTTQDVRKGIVNLANSELTDWEYALTVPKLKVVEYYPALRIGIAKVILSGVANIQKIFEKTVSVNESNLSVKVVRISGIIKKAKKWIAKTQSQAKISRE